MDRKKQWDNWISRASTPQGKRVIVDLLIRQCRTMGLAEIMDAETLALLLSQIEQSCVMRRMLEDCLSNDDFGQIPIPPMS